MQGLEEAATTLVQASKRELPFEPEFRPLAHEDAPAVAAVDGSCAVLLDNGVAWAVAVRAAATRWPTPSRSEVEPRIIATLPEEAPEILRQHAEALGVPAPPDPQGADGFAAELSLLAEVRQARDALRRLPKGGILLWDGALYGTPRQEQVASLQRDDVVAVAKRSGLRLAGTPVLPALLELGPQAVWVCPIPEHPNSHAARLHPRARHAFRIDATSQDAVAALVPLCKDAVYTGYPYPLALAHNRVAITGATKRNLQARLEEAVRKAGGARALVRDFHDVLDRNVP